MKRQRAGDACTWLATQTACLHRVLPLRSATRCALLRAAIDDFLAAPEDGEEGQGALVEGKEEAGDNRWSRMASSVLGMVLSYLDDRSKLVRIERTCVAWRLLSQKGGPGTGWATLDISGLAPSTVAERLTHVVTAHVGTIEACNLATLATTLPLLRNLTAVAKVPVKKWDLDGRGRGRGPAWVAAPISAAIPNFKFLRSLKLTVQFMIQCVDLDKERFDFAELPLLQHLALLFIQPEAVGVDEARDGYEGSPFRVCLGTLPSLTSLSVCGSHPPCLTAVTADTRWPALTEATFMPPSSRPNDLQWMVSFLRGAPQLRSLVIPTLPHQFEGGMPMEALDAVVALPHLTALSIATTDNIYASYGGAEPRPLHFLRRMPGLRSLYIPATATLEYLVRDLNAAPHITKFGMSSKREITALPKTLLTQVPSLGAIVHLNVVQQEDMQTDLSLHPGLYPVVAA